MKKLIFGSIALLALCCAVLTSCLVPPNGGSGNEGGDDPGRDNYSIVRSEESGNTMMSVREAYYAKYYLMLNIVSDDTEVTGKEIVMGETSRAITKQAKSLLEAAIAKESYKDGAGFIVYKSGDSFAVYWSDVYITDKAIDYFITEYINADAMNQKDGYVYTDVFSLSAYKKSDEAVLEEEYYAKIAEGLGADAAEALRNLYAIYDERLYMWEASLYDPGVGGYYYSNSALATQGYLPDLESTVQALRFIAQSGMLNNFGGSANDLRHVLPEEMVQSFINFAHSCQSSADGYYYHPQWGENISDLRQGRDLGWGVSLLSIFGEIPLYNTPSGVKGSLGAPGYSGTSSLTEKFGTGSVVTAVSRVMPCAVADRFSSEEKFTAYFNSFSWADPTVGSHEGSSYHPAGTLSGQTSQIKAAGLGELCIRLYDEMQERVQENLRAAGLPENGLWDPHNSYDAINGVMKITAMYSDLGGKINYAEQIMECVIEIILLEEEDFDGNTPTGGITVYNPWVSASAVLSNMNKFGSKEDVAYFRGIIRDNAADAISATMRKAVLFKRDDGSFGIYSSGKAPANQYGSPIAVKDSIEGDINGAGVISTGTLRTMSSTLKISEFIGWELLPMFYESDLDVYLDIMLNASPVVKDEIVLSNDPVGFEDDARGTTNSDISGVNLETYGGNFSVEADPVDPTNNALKLSTVYSDIGGDRITVSAVSQSAKTHCYVLEWDMYVDEIVGTPTVPFQIKLDDCFMLAFGYDSGRLELYSYSGTSGSSVTEKLGVSVKLGEWHKYRVEYYRLDDGTTATKIYVDDQLRAISNVYYGMHSGKAPKDTYQKAVIFATRTCNLTAYFDNIFMEKVDTPYVESPLESPERLKDFEDLPDGKMYDSINVATDGIASVVTDPDEGDKALRISGKGSVYVSASASSADPNCYVLDTQIYVEQGSGEVCRLLLAQTSSVPIVGYVITVEDDTAYVYELTKNGANVDVLGEIVGSFNTEEWVDLSVEYYRYQRKAIVTVDGETVVSEAFYRLAYLGKDYMQLSIVMDNGTVYFDDLLAERTEKAYVEDGVTIPDSDKTFPTGQSGTTTSAGIGFNGVFDFEDQELDATAVPGTSISPNGEVGNTVKVEEDPAGGDNQVLAFNTEYSASKGNSIKFTAYNGNADVVTLSFDFYFAAVGNSSGSRVNELSFKDANEKNIISFAFNYNGNSGMSFVEKEGTKKELFKGITMNEWHSLTITYDRTTGTALISIDGGEAVVSTAYSSEATYQNAVSYCSLLANQRTNEQLYIDNVNVVGN